MKNTLHNDIWSGCRIVAVERDEFNGRIKRITLANEGTLFTERYELEATPDGYIYIGDIPTPTPTE